ncbi:MAG TPA: DUF4209 domain-containing protein [Longimicrobium sp.]
MPVEQPITLSKEDFDRLEWQDVPSTDEDERVLDYANPYYDRANDAFTRGDARSEAAFRLLADLCSFKLELESYENPFRPWLWTDTVRSASPDSISQDHVEVLRELAPLVSDAALRARIADFVWVRGRGYPTAQIAVAAYLELAKPLEDTDPSWPGPIRYLERGLQIALQLSRNSEPYQTVSTFILNLLRARVGTETGFLSKQLLSLAAKHRIGDASELYDIAVMIASRAETQSGWHKAEQYWQVATELARGEQEKRREAFRRLAECYVGRAHEAAKQPHIGNVTAATYLEHAIEALRREGGFSERVDELHVEMMEYQRKIPESLVPVSSSIDITRVVAEAEEAVTDKSLQEALLSFALLADIPKYSNLLEDADESSRRYLFKSFFPSVQLNREGKVIDRQGPLHVSDPEQREAVLRKDMLQTATLHYQVSGRAVIDPARRRIMEEHGLRIEDFFWIVSNNPLVPQGREMLFAEAFYAGFAGDMTKAIPLLVFQLENSIRELLVGAGVIVTAIDNEGIQSERGLNWLLFQPKLKELLGEDIVFALQGLLVEKFGSNIRNDVAHGLISYEEYFSYVALYLWWLSFRLVCIPALNAITRGKVEASNESPEASVEVEETRDTGREES